MNKENKTKLECLLKKVANVWDLEICSLNIRTNRNPIVIEIKIKKTNVAIIMVEQNAKQALSISDRGYVLVTGKNKFEGSGKDLLNDPEVRRSFLGA